MLFGEVSSSNYCKYTKICPFLFIPHTYPAFIKYALTFEHVSDKLNQKYAYKRSFSVLSVKPQRKNQHFK